MVTKAEMPDCSYRGELAGMNYITAKNHRHYSAVNPGSNVIQIKKINSRLPIILSGNSSVYMDLRNLT